MVKIRMRPDGPHSYRLFNGPIFTKENPVQEVEYSIAQRLLRQAAFQGEQGRPYGERCQLQGGVLYLVRSHQALDNSRAFFPLYRALAKLGLPGQFLEVQRNEPNDKANENFLAEQKVPFYNMTQEEPQQWADHIGVKYEDYDVLSLTAFARFRWRSMGQTADDYLMARTIWYLRQYETYFKEADPKLLCTWGDMCHEMRAAIAVAEKMKIPVLRLEGGFVPRSSTVDMTGMYFNGKNDFDEICKAQKRLNPPQRAALKKFIKGWKDAGKTKYNKPTNHQRMENADVRTQAPEGKRILLVICQTTGDATMFFPETMVQNKDRLARVVCNAMKDEEEWVVLVKPHPYEDHRGLVSIVQEQENANLLLNVSAHSALRAADAVVTINSTMGFEALMYGLPVVTLGDNIYTRRGVTTDVRDTANDLAGQIREAVVKAKKPPKAKLEQFLYAIIFKYLFMHEKETGRLDAIVKQLKTSN